MVKLFFRIFGGYLLILLVSGKYHSQTLTNNGGFIKSMPGSFIRVNGSVQNDYSGVVTINGNGTPSSAELYVSQDVINNASINANGYIRLLGNWIDNNTYTSSLGTVFMEGANQLLSGTSPTTFFNLTLDGSGVKTQTINKYVNGVLDLKSLELNTSTLGMYVQNPAINAILRSPALPESVQGFVSSANGGFLSRATNSTGTYLFPVGSVSNLSTNVATAPTTDDRYRPVEIVPNSATASSYTVRMANVDATTETFDRTLIAPTICAANPLFYHQINRSSGTTDASVTINFIESLDGHWQGIARWHIATPNLWEEISGSTITAGTPFSQATKTIWNNFSSTPYILYNVKPTVTVTGADICSGSTTSVTANPNPAGTYTYNWTVPITFTPVPGNNYSTFDSGIAGTYSVVIIDPVTFCQSDPIECTFELIQNPSIIFLSPP